MGVGVGSSSLDRLSDSHSAASRNVHPAQVDALTTLLRYKTQNAGCCKIILHPRWGSAVYPSSLFTKAPLDRLTAAIRATEEQLKGASA